jgi:hypothetical protein
MPNLLTDLAKSSTLLKGGAIILGTYFVAPMVVRAAELDYYFTLGGLLGRTAENAALVWAGGLGGVYLFLNRKTIIDN